MSDYIYKHNWGCYDCDNKINKLLLRNKSDFIKYIKMIIKDTFIAKISNDFTITFFNGTSYLIKIKYLI